MHAVAFPTFGHGHGHQAQFTDGIHSRPAIGIFPAISHATCRKDRLALLLPADKLTQIRFVVGQWLVDKYRKTGLDKGTRPVQMFPAPVRSEERRVGKECRSRWSQ